MQAGVVAVAGGIDVLGTGINMLDENGIPYVGGIPVSTLSARARCRSSSAAAPGARSSATWTTPPAGMHAKRISIVYGDFGAIADAAQLGERVGRSLGLR